MLAHMESTRSETENLFVRSQAVPVDQAYTAMLEATRSSFHRATRLTTSLLPNGMGQKGVTANGELPSVGSPVVPVVMVEFPDISFSLTDEQELDRKLFFDDERGRLETKFNLDGLLRGDMAARAQFYHTAVLDGWMSRNEAREMEHLNPLDGLDKMLYPGNENIVGQKQEVNK